MISCKRTPNTAVRYLCSHPYLWVCLLLLSAYVRVHAQDSVSTIPVPEAVEIPSSNHNVYKDSGYFNPIPVAQKVSSDAEAAAQSFQSIREKYSSESFNYVEDRVERLSWWHRLRRRFSDFLRSIIPDWRWKLNDIFYYVLVGIGVAALLYILFRLTGSGRKIGYKEEKAQEEPAWIEQQLTTTDLQPYLNQALADKDFVQAIRYLHLINLKKLSASGQIEWNYQKTHQELLQELKNERLYDGFVQTIRIYEYIWYGKFAIEEERFKHYEVLFHQFNQAIS